MKSKFYKRFAMVFTTILMFTFIATSQTTITVRVSDPMDDCEEVAVVVDPADVLGFMDHGSSDLELCTEDNIQAVGIIFRNILIPPNATISEAYVQFECDDLNDEEISLEIWGAAEATVVAPFTDALFGVTSHAKTTARVSWSPPAWAVEHEAGEAQRTPDLSAIIAEIVAVPGWAAGNNIMIALTDDQTEKIHREAEAYDGEPEGAPLLSVTFTEASGTNQIRPKFSNLIYPNPTEGRLYINNPSEDKFSYEIYSITGKLFASRHNITGSTTEVDLSDYAKGVYFVNVKTIEKTETQKLILK